jgi:hypothetical protein
MEEMNIADIDFQRIATIKILQIKFMRNGQGYTQMELHCHKCFHF